MPCKTTFLNSSTRVAKYYGPFLENFFLLRKIHVTWTILEISSKIFFYIVTSGWVVIGSKIMTLFSPTCKITRFQARLKFPSWTRVWQLPFFATGYLSCTALIILDHRLFHHNQLQDQKIFLKDNIN